MKTVEKKTIKLLARVSALLSQIASEGIETAGRSLDREIANVLEGLRFYRLHRLHRCLSKVRSLLGRGKSGDDLLLATLLGDALYTSKAVKTYLKGRLDDPRIAQDVLGKAWDEDELETLPSLRLVVVGCDDRHRYYLEIPTMRVFVTTLEDEAARDSDIGLEAAEPSGELRAEGCLLHPSYPPETLTMGKTYEGSPTAEAISQITMAAASDYAAQVEALRAGLANLFAPRYRCCVLRFDALVVDPMGHFHLGDGKNKLIRVAQRDEGQTKRANAMAWIATRRKPAAVFGKLFLRKDRVLFAPLALIGEGLPFFGVAPLHRLDLLLSPLLQ